MGISGSLRNRSYKIQMIQRHFNFKFLVTQNLKRNSFAKPHQNLIEGDLTNSLMIYESRKMGQLCKTPFPNYGLKKRSQCPYSTLIFIQNSHNSIYDNLYMRRLLNQIQGKEEEKKDETIDLHEIIENDSYEIDDEDQQYFDNINKFEHQKAKLWTKPDFQSHLQVFAKLKYSKDLNITNVGAYRVYKRLYNEKIKNNNDYSLYDKVLYHPDLTQIDYQFITDQNSKVVRNAGIVELTGITCFGIAYFKTSFKNKPAFYPIAFISPAVLLYAAFAIERIRLTHTLKKVGLDKKYNIQ